MKAHLFVLLVLASAQEAVLAAAATQVDPSVTSVVTAGYWELSGKSGTFRVVMSHDGFEHVNTTVVAEWVEESSSPTSSPRVRTSRDLLRNHLASFEVPDLKIYSNRVRVTLKGVPTQIPDSKVSCVFDLLGDGTVRVVRECS
jgi:hypothetical protein